MKTAPAGPEWIHEIKMDGYQSKQRSPAGNVIARIGPLLGIEPRYDLPPADRLILAASTARQ